MMRRSGNAGETSTQRVILHLDVDSFYVTCERLRRPELRGRPVAVTQFNSGGFVAVSSEARQKGIRKGDGIGKGGASSLPFFKDRNDATMEHVKAKCPNLVVLQMDTPYYRQCSEQIHTWIKHATAQQKETVVEKVSIDDFFVDVTAEVARVSQQFQPQRRKEGAAAGRVSSNVFDAEAAVTDEESSGDDEDTEHSACVCPVSASPVLPRPCPTYMDPCSIYCDKKPAHPDRYPCTSMRFGEFSAYAAARVAHDLRAHVCRVSGGVTLSCGIASNKLLARLVSKRRLLPDQQTMLLPGHEVDLLAHVPLCRVPGLGGKLGAEISQTHGVKSLTELQCLRKVDLIRQYGEARGSRIYDAARGIDPTPVAVRPPPQTLLAEKSFPLSASLTSAGQLLAPVREVAAALAQRVVEEYTARCRFPTAVVVHWRVGYNRPVSRRVAYSFAAVCTSEVSEPSTTGKGVIHLFSDLAKKLAGVIPVPLAQGLTRLGFTATKFVHGGSTAANGSIDSFLSQSCMYKANAPRFKAPRRWENSKTDQHPRVMSSSARATNATHYKVSPSQRTIAQKLGELAESPEDLRRLEHLCYERIIICIDQDCFYAQVAMNAQPELRGKPLGIFQKYLIVTCNYPARSRGVTKLMPIAKAVTLCPELKLVSGERLDAFRAASAAIFRCVKSGLSHICSEIGLSPQRVPVEKSGLDELYIDVTDLCVACRDAPSRFAGHVIGDSGISSAEVARRYRFAAHIAETLRRQLRQTLHFNSCAGISSGKLGAKLAVNANKPNDQTTLLPSSLLAYVLPLPLSHLTGVGRTMCRRLQESDYKATCAEEVLPRTLTQLQQVLDPRGARLVFLSCRGLDESCVTESGPCKIISVEDSMKRCTTVSAAGEYLRRMAMDLLIREDEDTLEHQRQPTRVTLKTRQHGFASQTGGVALPQEIAEVHRYSRDERATILFRTVQQLFRRRKFADHATLTVIGIGVSNFEPLGSGHAPSLSSMLAKPAASASSSTKNSPPAAAPTSMPAARDALSWRHIDPSVLKELPASIRAEISAEMKRRADVDSTGGAPAKRRRIIPPQKKRRAPRIQDFFGTS